MKKTILMTMMRMTIMKKMILMTMMMTMQTILMTMMTESELRNCYIKLMK